MTSLASIISDVYSLTNRPDLVGETALAVRNATLKCHQKDFYYKDLTEATLEFPTSEYLQSFEYKTAFPRWRAAKYLRKVDVTTTPITPGVFIDLLTPEAVLDDYATQKENVFYVAGLELQIRSNTQEQYYLLGCYQHPDVTVTGYSSWIADEHPMAVIYEAASVIFKTIGYDEQAAVYRGLCAEEFAAISLSNIVAVGY